MMDDLFGPSGQSFLTASELLLSPWHAGVDEVGIGPLAGPVVAGAVILDPARPIAGLADSKKLKAQAREALAADIRRCALGWGLGAATVEEIDRLNILNASHLAMQRAIDKLSLKPKVVFVDGNKTPKFGVPCVAVVKGDDKVPAISAASILAKVCRDRLMQRCHRRFPAYGFGQHMGYPTKQHLDTLASVGACAFHRRSFAPVRAALEAAAGRESPGAAQSGLFLTESHLS